MRPLPLAGSLVLTAVLLAGCGSDDEPVVEAPVPTATTTSSSAPSVAPTPTSTLPAGVDQVVAVEVRGGEVVGGARRVKVSKGSVVELVVTSDVADEVHLHTYDEKVDVVAGGTARLRFTASIPGVIECELEGAHLTLLRFQVQ